MFAATGALTYLSRRWMTCFGLQLATRSGPHAVEMMLR